MPRHAVCIVCVCALITSVASVQMLTCVSCGVGHFLSQTSGLCVQCPANSSTLDSVNATDVEACVCASGHFNESHICHECVRGNFKSTAGDFPCTPCHANSHTADTGADDAGTCECNAGFERVAFTTLFCSACPAGKYKSNTGDQPCTECPADSFCGDGALEPTRCPANATASAGSGNLIDCHCVPGFRRDEARECHACGAGKYQPQADQDSCVACPFNTFLGDRGASNISECTVCGFNAHTAAEGSTAITDCLCNIGYAGEPGELCDACRPGTFRANLSDYICEECAVNSYNEAYGSTHRFSCEPCPDHTSTADLSRRGKPTDCVCDAGFSGTLGNAALAYVCTACPPGTFQTARNQSGCLGCKPGTYATVEQANTEAVCERCADGSFTVDAAQTVCSACPVSTWQNTSDLGVTAVNCSRCPEHSTHASTGVTDVGLCVCGPGRVGRGVGREYHCAPCDAGSFCPGNRTQTACADDSWSPGGNFAGPCVQCAAHSRTAAETLRESPQSCLCRAGAEGSFDSNCTLCATGKIRASFDAPAECAPCPANTYAENRGLLVCDACPANAHAPAGSSNRSACTCVAGFFGPAGGDCEQCPPDTFCPGGAASNPCMRDGTAAAGAVDITNCSCRAGYYTEEIGTTCSSCRYDHYCPGAMNIYRCPENATSHSNAASLAQCICDPGHWRGCVANYTGHFVGPHGLPCTVDFSLACSQCGEDVVCINNTLTHCQPHSSAPAGNHDNKHCVCDGGFREEATDKGFRLVHH